MAMFSVVFAALAVVVASASAALDRPVVCFRNVEGNPRTASLFERETLNEFSHSYLYLMEAVANNSGFACDHIVLLVEHNFNNPSVCALEHAIWFVDACASLKYLIFVLVWLCSEPQKLRVKWHSVLTTLHASLLETRFANFVRRVPPVPRASRRIFVVTDVQLQRWVSPPCHCSILLLL